ncbi:hypothetical protein [Bradyrhizobium lablabi]|uniref:hypothetical protein n=1 Tax=Bradyrhizobium lablabi TaxID=722472 RepID=UPI0020130CFA|nr:hypothetical protein [Bradyrhizobium lablabi]
MAEAGPEAASAGHRGGAFPYGVRRALRCGKRPDASPLSRPVRGRAALLPKFREMATETRRDLASVPITIWGAKENLDLLKRDRDDGFSRVVVSLDSDKGDKMLPALDRSANLIRQPGS